MGNIYSAKEYLYSYIEIGDTQKIAKILEMYPQLINEPMTKDCKTLPLARAAWRGNQKVCQLLIELGAKINLQSKKGKTALIWAVIRDRFNIVLMLIEQGADCLIKDDLGLDIMDYAILTGNYKMALYLKENQMIPYRLAQFYYQFNQNFTYVNYSLFLDQLDMDVLPENVQDYRKEPQNKVIIEDPVIDPRETWTQFFTRIKDFEDPPICERKELPLEFQPQSSYVKMARSYINGKSPYPKQKVERRIEHETIEIISFKRNKINIEPNQHKELSSDNQTNFNLINQEKQYAKQDENNL